jgi:hypothetical protein
MTKLEDTVKSMQTTERHLDAGIKALQVHEKSLLDWIRDLETALVSRGGRDQVDSIRRMWSTAPPAVQLPPRQRDSLATLASAAAYQPAAPQSRWEEDAPSHKRRRSEDDYTEAMQKRQHGARLPSPSRMRIDQLCLPLPRPSSHSPPAAIAPEWGWSPHDHTAPAAYHQYEGKSRLQSQQSFDGKPRVIAGPSPLDSRSTAPRRPLSANSDGTRSWDSPVHSYDVRL